MLTKASRILRACLNALFRAIWCRDRSLPPPPSLWAPERRDELMRRYKGGFAGVAFAHEVVAEVRRDKDHYYYRCPCGGRDHHASRRINRFGLCPELSDVLHCWESGQQWMVLVDVAGTIAREEAVFNALLDRFGREGLVGKEVTAREAFRLVTECGVPQDLLEIDDTSEFERLMDDHRAVSRAGRGSR